MHSHKLGSEMVLCKCSVHPDQPFWSSKHGFRTMFEFLELLRVHWPWRMFSGTIEDNLELLNVCVGFVSVFGFCSLVLFLSCLVVTVFGYVLVLSRFAYLVMFWFCPVLRIWLCFVFSRFVYLCILLLLVKKNVTDSIT